MFKRWKSLKAILVLALAAVMLLSWAAFSGAEVITITVGDFKCDPPRLKTRESIARLFEKENPGVKVKMHPLIGDWGSKITTQMAAGNPPDVIVAGYPVFRKWIDMRQGLILDDYVAEEVKDMNPLGVAIYGYDPDGHLCAIPAMNGWFTLYYNKDMFDEAGVSYPDDSWDWNSLLEASKKLTSKEPGKPAKFGFVVPGRLSWNLCNFIWQNGGHVTPNDVDPGDKILIDSPEAMEALKFVHDMVWKHHVAPTPAELGDSPQWYSFLVGINAMQIGGADDFAFNTEGCNFRWDIAQLPKGPVKRAVRGGVEAVMGYRGTKHPDEVIKYIKFRVSPKVQEILMKEEGLMTCRLSVMPRYQELMPFPLNSEAYLKEAPYVIPVGRFFKDAPKVYEMLTPALERIFLLNKVSIEEGIPELCKEINAYLAKYRTEAE